MALSYRRQLTIALGLLAVAAVGALWLRWSRPPETAMIPTPDRPDVKSYGGPVARVAPPAERAPARDAVAEKVAVLDEVLAARNDNDPRLDLAFRELTPEAKEAFRARYRAMAREKLNERGTIVYLLGREVKTPEDARFLREVALEPPCGSLRDCRRPATEEDPEMSAVNDVSLSYPQMMALKSMESYLKRNDRDPEISREFLSAVEKAKASLSAPVSRLARRLAAGP